MGLSDEKKCLEGPILINFFLKFLIRSRVFPEEEAALQRAITLCDLAKKELPATWTLGRRLPDKLSKGFEDLNTIMTTGMYGRGIIIDPFSDDSENENEPADSERDAKKRKLEEELLKKALEEKDKPQADGTKTEPADVVVLPVDAVNVPSPAQDVLVVVDEGSESGSSGTSTPLEGQESQSTQWLAVDDGSSW